MGERTGITPKEIEIADRLRNQWRNLLAPYGSPQNVIDDEFSRLEQEYRKGEGRSYHNIRHIGKVDEMLNRYRHLAKNFTALKLAGDGHDVIYVPASETNEADSAVYMEGALARMNVPLDVIGETSRIINITKDHKTSDDDIDGKLMIDADFAIFASDPSEYDEYSRGIKNEYVGSGRVTEEMFRVGRSSLIRGWLDQERIYLTDQIRDEMEPVARQNLQRELVHLTS